ncbi:acyltransferase [Ilumatobacter coccineus]|uniref:Sugar acetyltransferase n=1 Tax=Ilumatobacter coccineus (strain NBRC 103263 / KCTC 29153 / YM16-304) TaxID=1313172 RepID=A0A6C7E5B8_ILUCY|nr:acyltransferase [Ilumatobacter coccineus]BAN01761.1 sugar acetyltransferase [Ilumatobacter coccineus YM16-304]
MQRIHETAHVEDGVEIGDGTAVWSHTQIRPGARIGRNCNIGRNVFVDTDVSIGDNVKIQNNASLFEGTTLESGVFVGPHVIFTNDRVPRAITPAGDLKTADDWELGRILVRYGAAIGAGATIITGTEVGRWAMIGSGAVVTHDVPDYTLIIGNPGRVAGYVSAAGRRCDSLDMAVTLSESEAQRVTGS